MDRGRYSRPALAAFTAARYSIGLASTLPAIFMASFLTMGSWLRSAMIWRHLKICSWMLILTGQTWVQLPLSVEAKGSELYLRKLNVGSMMTPIGPEYVAP